MARGAQVWLATGFRCDFLSSVGERPRISARYVGLSRLLRLRLQMVGPPGREDIDCAIIPNRKGCDIERNCVREFALLAARIAEPLPTGVDGK
jgi:hypothetical protein